MKILHPCMDSLYKHPDSMERLPTLFNILGTYPRCLTLAGVAKFALELYFQSSGRVVLLSQQG